MTEFKNTQNILKKFNLTFLMESFINLKMAETMELPAFLLEDLQFALAHVGPADKEAFTCEFIIVPFLKESWKRHSQLNLFSHVAIQADDLVAIPDYIVAAPTSTGWKELEKPLLLTTEAKYEKFDEGWTQALLQAIICQKMNQTVELPILMIVTNGEVWQFGQLAGQKFMRHPISAVLSHPAELLGTLDKIFARCEENAQRWLDNGVCPN